jgi:type 1 glutamine amidotransferase
VNVQGCDNDPNAPGAKKTYAEQQSLLGSGIRNDLFLTTPENLMKRIGLCAIAFLMAVSLLAGPNPSAAQNKSKVRVLFVVAGHGGDSKAPILEKLFADLGIFDVTVLKEKELPELAKLKAGDYDVLLFYGGPQTKEDQDRAIETFVEEGGGLVALHHASATGSAAWSQLIGGRFIGHPAISDIEVILLDTNHPITKGVESTFKMFDEAYKHKMAKVKVTPLAKLKERPGDKNPDPNLDILWTREVGKGRVVYNALGHGKEAWTNPNWQKLVVQSMLWAAGRPAEVKLPTGK